MKLPPHIFALARNEQRAVIVIVLALLAFAGFRYWREQNLQAQVPAAPPPAATPVLSATPEED